MLSLTGKLVRTLRELDTGILIDKGLMKLTKIFVLLFDLPSFFVVEAHVNTVLCICSMVHWVIYHCSFFDFTLYSHLEEVRSAKVVHVLAARLHMVQKHFGGVKTVAELALRCNAVLEAPRVGFEFQALSSKLIILCF